MVRTQIELTDEQAAELKKQAAEQGISLTEIVRRGIDMYLGAPHGGMPDEARRRRAIKAAGRFSCDQKHLSTDHDLYLAEVYD